MNQLKSSTCELWLSKVPFSYEDNYILGGNKSYEYFLNKRGFRFPKVQFSKFENELKYVLRLNDDFNEQFNQICYSDSYYNYQNYNKLFNYAVFYLSSEYKKEGTTDVETNTGYYLYFVKGVKWKSPQTIELELKMDVLNTLYLSNLLGQNEMHENHIFEYGKKSNITRYHKKRIQSYTGGYLPLIDKLSEGIQAPLYKKNDIIVRDNLRDFYNYYLIYKNSLDDSSDANNVVDCFLTYGELGNPQNKNVVVEGTSLRRFTSSNVGSLYIYLLGGFSFTIYDEITQETKNINITNTNAYCEIFAIGGVLRIRTDLLSYDTNPTYYVSNYMEFSSNITYYYSSAIISHPPTRSSIEALSSSVLTPTDSTLSFYDINKLNRTDSKLIKVIKLPYVPTDDIGLNGSSNFTYDSDIWIYDSNTKMLKLKDLNTKFKSEISEDWHDVTFSVISANSKSPTASRSIDNEYKLFHSDFGYNKLNYDSFNLIIYNELLSPDYTTSLSSMIEFYSTTTINSRFIFKFSDDIYEEAYTDYATTLSISRNNELGLYNSSYINYIRNGFNYDVKNKNRNVGVQYGLGAVQILGAVGSAISSASTGGFGVIGAISLGTSAIATLTHAINSQISQETQIQQKLESLKAQANEIESSDDVDLLDVYNQNKLHLMSYRVSSEMKQLLFNLFHYTGYIANVIDSITNYINTRYWFNYIQCDLHLINVSKQIPKDILEEFKAKFNDGVTIFHRHTGITSASVEFGYNIKQDLENWDSELVNES